MPASTGDIANYRLIRLIGEGGMGQVYEAEQVDNAQLVALKLLNQELAHEATSIRRFLNEANVLSRLNHPGLIKVLASGVKPDGLPYLVMELLPGETLAVHLSRCSPLGIQRAAQIGAQVAEATAAAHAQGIVHRDLKPSNLMLIPPAPSGVEELVKVLDFGIAKLLPMALAPAAIGPTTRSRATLGTAEYMAPEQCRDARNVDGKADVYALGVILYEMLAGQRPFAAETAAEVMLLQMRAAPAPLRARCPLAGDALAALVHQTLAKVPSERPTMAEVAQRLSAARSAEFSPATDEDTTSASVVARATPSVPWHRDWLGMSGRRTGLLTLGAAGLSSAVLAIQWSPPQSRPCASPAYFQPNLVPIQQAAVPEKISATLALPRKPEGPEGKAKRKSTAPARPRAAQRTVPSASILSRGTESSILFQDRDPEGF